MFSFFVFTGVGRPTSLTSLEEAELVTSLKLQSQWGIGLTRAETQEVVGDYIKSIGRDTQFVDGVPADDWLDSFFKRHPELTLRMPEQLKSSRAKSWANKPIYEHWFNPNRTSRFTCTIHTVCWGYISTPSPVKRKKNNTFLSVRRGYISTPRPVKRKKNNTFLSVCRGYISTPSPVKRKEDNIFLSVCRGYISTPCILKRKEDNIFLSVCRGYISTPYILKRKIK